MAASMFLPTFAVIALMGSGAIDFWTAMGIEHTAMLPSMLVAMLLRRDEYSSHAHHAPSTSSPDAATARAASSILVAPAVATAGARPLHA